MTLKTWAIIRKDLQLIFLGGGGLVQAVLLGLLLIFVFSLANPVGEKVLPQAAAAIFWLASSFALILVFNTLYSLEEENLSRIGLILAPIPVQMIWIGKAVAGALLLILAQIIFFPAVVVFLGQESLISWPKALVLLLSVDWGLVSIGSLLGAVSQGHNTKDSLLSIIVFPLLIPLLLGGIRLGALYLGADMENPASWFGLIFSFDALFTGAALILFPFIYTGE
ncbi:heme exporter protein CcmB [Desulfovulcanus sp.]